ncbi:MAG: EthD family reductase [Chitinophagaceae bacterium]|nr:MAG: EthD family reductase [Chitinophagaceae bacterium]
MIKVTVLYHQPTDADVFEKYYQEMHHPLVLKTNGIVKWEYTKFLPQPDGTAPAYYRMAELYFNTPEAMQEAMSSAEGKSMAADLSNFASGGVTILFGTVKISTIESNIN